MDSEEVCVEEIKLESKTGTAVYNGKVIEGITGKIVPDHLEVMMIEDGDVEQYEPEDFEIRE